jgi:hypothetical protein
LCAVIGVSRRIPRRSTKRSSIEKGRPSAVAFFVRNIASSPKLLN